MKLKIEMLKHRSEGFPARDIWSLGVMAQGPGQMGRVLGKPPPPPSPPSLGNSGWHSGQETIFRGFPKVLDSWWKISENGDRGFTQNFAARLMSIVVCSGEPFLKKCITARNQYFLKMGMSKKSRNSYYLKMKDPAYHHRSPFQNLP